MKMSEADNPTSATPGSAANSDSEHASSTGAQSGNNISTHSGKNQNLDEEEEHVSDNDEEAAEDEEDEEENDEEDEEEEEEEAEEETVDLGIQVGITSSLLAEGLKLLCKTGNSMAHALVRLDASNRGLSDITGLRTFQHLRYVDLSKNEIRDLTALGFLQDLITLNVSENRLKGTGRLSEKLFLQQASFASNDLTSLAAMNHPMLEKLCVSFNLIKSVSELDAGILTRIHTLELRGNKLQTTLGIELPCLRNLYLAHNEITSVQGLYSLQNLEVLHLRDNKIESLSRLSAHLPKLQYLNCRENSITHWKQIKTLKSLLGLRTLILSGNPIAETETYRNDVLVSAVQLDRLDKIEFTAEEKADAVQAAEERRLQELEEEAEEERLRLEQEEELKRLKEEEELAKRLEAEAAEEEEEQEMEEDSLEIYADGEEEEETE